MTEAPRDRFLRLDTYRVEREWTRYEGTAQRELFRELRARFLSRHRVPGDWVVDLGSGPGRFSDALGAPNASRVLLDLSAEALRTQPKTQGPIRRSGARWHRIRADAARPPLRPGRFANVALLGNVLGFSEARWPELLDAAIGLTAPGGRLLLEAVEGSGGHSRYLRRLPPGAVARALRGPSAWLRARVESEGFAREVARRGFSNFRRIRSAELTDRLRSRQWAIDECLAVAPALGSDPDRIEAARAAPDSWKRLLELEEALGRAPERISGCAAYLVSARAPSDRD